MEVMRSVPPMSSDAALLLFGRAASLPSSAPAIATEDTSAMAVGGATGAVAVGGQVVVLHSDVEQWAHIDTGATIPQAGGGVFVTGSATRNPRTLSIGAGFGAVAAGASISINSSSGDTKAEIGNVAVGTDAPLGGTVRGITVAATNDARPTATSFSVQAGGGGALSGSVAVVTYSGTTRAASGASGPLGIDGYTVAATGRHGDLEDGTRENGVDARTFNVAVGGGITLGVTVAIARNERNTEAAITGGTTSTTGAVNVTADAENTAFAHAPQITIGSASLSFMLRISHSRCARPIMESPRLMGSLVSNTSRRLLRAAIQTCCRTSADSL